MGRLKIIVNRPASHYIIISAYILAPAVNILMIRLAGQVPFQLIFRNFFNGFGLFAGLWLISAPLVAIGFYFVNKTSWYLFIGHSSLILIDFLYKWLSRPVYYIKTVPLSHNALTFTGNIILILIVAFVMQKNFRAPYFQKLRRHWRKAARIPIHHTIKVNGVEMNIKNLSSGGCFLLKSGIDLKIDKEHDILFKSDRLYIECKGLIMRQTETGYGIMFRKLSTTQIREIKHFLKKRFSLRQQIEVSATWVKDGISKDVTLLDISKGGSFIKCSLEDIDERDPGTLTVNVLGKEHNIHGKVYWINHQGEHNKPDGFGVSFRMHQAGLIRDMLSEYGDLDYTQ